MTGYALHELINHDINLLCPKNIAIVHAKLVRRYFDSAKPKVIGIRREIFCKGKDGYIFPIYLLVKTYPSVMHKLMFVGYI